MADQTTGARSEPLRFDPISSSSSSSTGSDNGGAAAVACSQCANPIGAYYYESAGAVFCARCKRATEEKAGHAASGGGMGTGAIFGFGAALAGAFLYWLFMKVTGFDYALVAIGVAFMVGSAIRKGNGGRGGRRFQILAVALTYFAIGAANAPFLFEGMASAKTEAAAQADSAATTAIREALADAGADTALATDATPRHAVAEQKSDTSPALAFVLALGAVLLLVLSGPVLATIFGGFPSAIINVIIVGIALQKAWQMSGEGEGPAAQTFTGPYKVATQSPSAAAGG